MGFKPLSWIAEPFAALLGVLQINKRGQTKMVATKGYSLTYFNIPALGEPIRLLFLLGKVEYEDKRIEFKDWPELKPTTKWGQVPVLVTPEGDELAQSRSILRYIARTIKVEGFKEELYPGDALKAHAIDELMDVFDDARQKLAPTFAIKDQAEKEAARAALFAEDGDIAKILLQIETFVGDEYCVTGTLTLADVYTYWILNFLRSGFFDGIPTDFLGKYPKLTKIVASVQALPGVAEYYKEMAAKNPMYAPFVQ